LSPSLESDGNSDKREYHESRDWSGGRAYGGRRCEQFIASSGYRPDQSGFSVQNSLSWQVETPRKRGGIRYNNTRSLERMMAVASWIKAAHRLTN
jgi:hypothetical protein